MPRLTQLVAVGILAVLGCVQAAVIDRSRLEVAPFLDRYRPSSGVLDAQVQVDGALARLADGAFNLIVDRDGRNGEDHVYDGRKSRVGTPRPHQGRDIIVPVDADVPVNVDLRAREASSGEILEAGRLLDGVTGGLVQFFTRNTPTQDDVDTERNFGLMRGYKRNEAEKGSEPRGLNILSNGQHEAHDGEEGTHMADEDTEEAMLMRTY